MNTTWTNYAAKKRDDDDGKQRWRAFTPWIERVGDYADLAKARVALIRREEKEV
tara:strand:- start:1526 stop:1687 length:162 start_codon:yes stop_codon:yes gene_type:complete